MCAENNQFLNLFFEIKVLKRNNFWEILNPIVVCKKDWLGWSKNMENDQEIKFQEIEIIHKIDQEIESLIFHEIKCFA
jgi:hypothetical protein